MIIIEHVIARGIVLTGVREALIDVIVTRVTVIARYAGTGIAGGRIETNS